MISEASLGQHCLYTFSESGTTWIRTRGNWKRERERERERKRKRTERQRCCRCSQGRERQRRTYPPDRWLRGWRKSVSPPKEPESCYWGLYL